MADDYNEELEEEEEEDEDEDEDENIETSLSKIKKHTTFDGKRVTVEFPGVTSTIEPPDHISSFIPCVQFDGYEAVAKNFVETIVDESATKAESLKVYDGEQEVSDETSSSAITFVEFFGSFTSWPTIAEFTVELGEDRIGEYLSTWYYEEDWLYCVELKLNQSDGCCDYYIYEITPPALLTDEPPLENNLFVRLRLVLEDLAKDVFKRCFPQSVEAGPLASLKIVVLPTSSAFSFRNDFLSKALLRTKWSLPTKEYPIPQATASIYFTIAVSRVKPPQCSVDVTYHYEGCRHIHIPFKHQFSEQWLFNIIEAKLKFFKTLRF